MDGTAGRVPQAGRVKAQPCPALLVSACASGQRETTVTAALARYHSRAGRRVRVFKTFYRPDGARSGACRTCLQPRLLVKNAGLTAAPAGACCRGRSVRDKAP